MEGCFHKYFKTLVFRIIKIGCFFLWMMCCNTNTIQAQRLKKTITKTLDWGYRIVQGDSAHPRKRYFFAVPILAYRPETRWMLGLSLSHIFRSRQSDSVTRPSTIRLNVTYTQNDQSSIRPYIDYFSAANKWNVRAIYTYTDFAEYYWGIGNTTPSDNRELYHFKSSKLNAKISRQIFPGVYAGIQYVVDQMFQMRYEDNSNLLKSGVTGFRGSYVSGAGPVIFFDNRDNIYFPSKGFFIELSNSNFNSVLGSHYTYNNVLADARKYVSWGGENVIATQAYMNLNFGDAPFRQIGTIGSDMLMRGYYNGRYRDQHAWGFQTELRKQIWGPLLLTAFVGAGNVGANASNLFQNIKPNAGIGARFKAIPREKFNIRLDYGWGSGGISAFYVTMGEAF
jgi:outer membrane protein assembly factor BamA